MSANVEDRNSRLLGTNKERQIPRGVRTALKIFLILLQPVIWKSYGRGYQVWIEL